MPAAISFDAVLTNCAVSRIALTMRRSPSCIEASVRSSSPVSSRPLSRMSPAPPALGCWRHPACAAASLWIAEHGPLSYLLTTLDSAGDCLLAAVAGPTRHHLGGAGWRSTRDLTLAHVLTLERLIERA